MRDHPVSPRISGPDQGAVALPVGQVDAAEEAPLYLELIKLTGMAQGLRQALGAAVDGEALGAEDLVLYMDSSL